MKTIKKGMAYSICNSVLCADCFHVFLDLRFNDDEMGRLYDGYRDDAYVRLREQYEPGYSAKNTSLVSGRGASHRRDVENFLKPFLNDSLKVLDWGGGSGQNTPFQETCDFLHIYDVADVPFVSEKATRVRNKENFSRNYSLIVCSHVLEHIPYPTDLLGEIKLAMNEQSILYLELPFENLMRETKDKSRLHEIKNHWHEHINFFNHTSLEALLLESHLKILELRTMPVSGESCDYVFQVCCTLKG